ncbi:hypothetical protein HK405_012109, partial [Cladochytrium tenue]
PYCNTAVWLAHDDHDDQGRQEPPRDTPLICGLRLRSLLARLLDSHRQGSEVRVGEPTLDFFGELDRLEAALPNALRLRLDADAIFAAVHDRPGGSRRAALDIFARARYASLFAVSSAASSLMTRLACGLTQPERQEAGGEGRLRAELLAAGHDAVGFWRAADAAVALAAMFFLTRRANAALAGSPLGELHYATLGAVMLSALLHLLRIAPALLAVSVDLGLVSPRATPYLYCIPADLYRTAPLTADDDFPDSPPKLLAATPVATAPLPPPFTLATIATLVRGVRACIDKYRTLWPVAEWMARAFDVIDTPGPDSVRAAAGYLALRPVFPVAHGAPASTAQSYPGQLHPARSVRAADGTAPAATATAAAAVAATAALPPRHRPFAVAAPDPLLTAMNPGSSLPLNRASLTGDGTQRLFSAAVVLRALAVGIADAVVPAAPPDRKPADAVAVVVTAVSDPVALPSY